jgi:hypothetical protein
MQKEFNQARAKSAAITPRLQSQLLLPRGEPKKKRKKNTVTQNKTKGMGIWCCVCKAEVATSPFAENSMPKTRVCPIDFMSTLRHAVKHAFSTKHTMSSFIAVPRTV